MISLHVFQLKPISIQALSFFIVFSFLFLIGQGIHYKEPPKTKTAPLDLEQLPCAVATLNQQGQIMAQNEAFEHLFSAKTKHPCWEANQHKLANLLSETQPKENQFSQLNLESISEKNKSFYVPFYSLQKTHYLFLFIPAPKQLQVSDWFSDWKKCLAHEMYTPLSSIQGFSKLLQEQHPDNHKFTHIITQHTHRMIASMRRFLDKQEPQEKRQRAGHGEPKRQRITWPDVATALLSNSLHVTNPKQPASEQLRGLCDATKIYALVARNIFSFFKERCVPRRMGTPRWVGAPRCALQEGRLFEKEKNGNAETWATLTDCQCDVERTRNPRCLLE